ncbi:MAG TPA: hypothetical protein VE868_01410 [Balneolaceae bacterium]|nr:hypothetical protein [Balneolaceae bacterium]
MDIFKLFYNHDQRLDKLAERNGSKSEQEAESSLQDFMNPTPTFSKFYLTGTVLEEEKFGLNQLNKYDQLLSKLDGTFKDQFVYSPSGICASLSEGVNRMSVGSVLIISGEKIKEQEFDFDQLEIDDDSNVGHRKDEIRELLLDNHRVLYKEKAKNGFDLHLFSKENIYPELFHPLQKLVDDSFRFFSINSKRMRSERHFYFETWTLDDPPHGAEEVFRDTVLRSIK